MAAVNLRDTIKYIEQNSFEGLVFENPDSLVIAGRQFAVARLTNYGTCPSYDALVKFIEGNGGTVKAKAVKSADYLIITPTATGEYSMVYKKEREKYEKAIDYHRTQNKPKIIRDVDFYIVSNMFTKLAMDDRRRLALEYVNGNLNFTDKTAKKVVDFIAQKARDDAYLQSQPAIMAIADQKATEKATTTKQNTNEKAITLQQWRKHFSFSEDVYRGKTGLILKKCKTLYPSICIPAEIEGKPIICVESKAFMNLGDLVNEVVIPATVLGVQNYAFCQCSGLQRVIIENPNCYIPVFCFAGCENLKEIIVNGANIAGDTVKIGGQNYVGLKSK